MNSLAETAIREHHLLGIPCQDNRTLVKDNDGKFYPKNPINSYVGRFADGLYRYLGCGSVDHLFRACLDKASKDMKQKK